MKFIVAMSALAALATAIPHAKRDIVWVTATEVVTEIVDVTKTVWINPGEATSSSSVQVQEKYVPVAPQNNNNQDAPHRHADYHAKPSTSTTVSTVVVPSSTSSPAPTAAVQPVVTSTTQAYVAPPPTTTPLTSSAAPIAQNYVAPVNTPSSSSPAAPVSSSPASYGGSSGDNGCSTTSGTCTDAKFTYYTPGMGSCGIENTDSDYIFAYGVNFMKAVGGANPNLNPLCGRKISITAFDGTEITATLTDTCQACTTDGMLDLSSGLWDRIAEGNPAADGVMTGMKYTWL